MVNNSEASDSVHQPRAAGRKPAHTLRCNFSWALCLHYPTVLEHGVVT